MNWSENTALRWTAYIVFSVFAFLVALAATFPNDQVSRIAAVQIEHRLEGATKTGYEVDISDLDLWWIGVELEGLSINRESPAETDGGAAAGPSARGTKAKKKKANNKAKKKKSGTTQPTSIEVPSIGARLAPIDSLLAGGLSVKYHLGLGGGAVAGSFTRSTSSQTLTVSIDELNLADSPLIEQWTGIPMYGRLRGGGRFELGGRRALPQGGSFDLTGKKVTVGPKPRLQIEALPVGYVSVPSINLGNFELKTHVEKDQGKNAPRFYIDSFRAKGVDLRLEAWGKLKLGRQVRANPLRTRVQFDTEFAEKNKSIKALQRHRKFQNGQRGNWYGLVFWGPFSGLNWKGSPTAAQGPSETKNKPPPGQSKGG